MLETLTTLKLQLKNRKCYYCTKSLKAQKFHPETPSCSSLHDESEERLYVDELIWKKAECHKGRVEPHTMGVSSKSVIAYEIFE